MNKEVQKKGMSKLGKIAIMAMLVLPSLIFYFFIWKGVNKVSRLPFYGPFTVVDKPYRGSIIKDTIPFEIKNRKLFTVDSIPFEISKLDNKIYFAHMLDFEKLDSVPKQITFAVKQIFEEHKDIRYVTYIEHYQNQQISLPSSRTKALEGVDSLWYYIQVPNELIDTIKYKDLFPKDPQLDLQKDPYSMVLIDKERRIRGYYNPTFAGDLKKMKEDVEHLKKEYLLNYKTHKYYQFDDKLEQKKK